MADKKHLDILAQGVEVWNNWREKHPDLIPDLSGASIENTDFHHAKLHLVNLRKANLRNSDFYWTFFMGANLEETDFSNSNLHKARFERAYAYRAIFNKAKLHDACFGEADLRKSEFKEAELDGARFEFSNLIDAKSLTYKQLIQVTTLYRAEMDQDIRNKIWTSCQRILDRPVWLEP